MRENLSIYREILQREFGQNKCFYCGIELDKDIELDHFIPWSHVKNDKLWNLVLSRGDCNRKKSNKIVGREYFTKLKIRNTKIVDMEFYKSINKNIVENDYKSYKRDLIERMRRYALYRGYSENKTKFI